MKFTVVICCHNKLQSVKSVVRSLNAIGGGHEYILSDDASTDGSPEWAEASGFFHKVLRASGPGKYRLNTLRNNGFENASNDHIVLIDGDCVPEVGFFEGHENVLMSSQNVISVGFTDFYDDKCESMIRKDPRWGDGKGQTAVIGWRDAFGGNMAMSKSVWDAVGRFDIDYNGKWGLEDLDFSYRAVKMGIELVADRRVVCRHIQHPINRDVGAAELKGKNNEIFFNKHGFRPC